VSDNLTAQCSSHDGLKSHKMTNYF